MNESQWSIETRPGKLLEFLTLSGWEDLRKLRLWVAGMCDVSTANYSSMYALPRWRKGESDEEDRWRVVANAKQWCNRDLDMVGDPPHVRRADMLREIVGNPFRPVKLNPLWITEPVVSMARKADTDLVFDHLPVLADALEDAGCTNADILSHLRLDARHYRGCWAIDSILGY